MSCSQTAKLIARIAENLPYINSSTMQELIDCPLALKRVLKKALNPSRIVRHPNISPWQQGMLGEFEVELVAVTTAELGFAGGQITVAEIYDRATEIGLGVVPSTPEGITDFVLTQKSKIDLVTLIGEISEGSILYSHYLKDRSAVESGMMDVNKVFPGKTRWIFIRPR